MKKAIQLDLFEGDKMNSKPEAKKPELMKPKGASSPKGLVTRAIKKPVETK
jgi:hypothetical protein